MPEKLHVFSYPSIIKLKQYFVFGKNPLVKVGDELLNELGLNRLETPYLIEHDEELTTPDGDSGENLRDIENCLKITKLLPELTPAEATDERLWVTLSFSEYFEYSLERWPDRGQAASPGQHIDNHWFAPNTRGRVRNNAIARLWWTSYHASKIADGGDVETVLKQLLFNTDYRQQILDRSSSSNCATVARVLLNLPEISGLPNTEEPADYSRKYWREFMKFVNLAGGRRNLAAMSEEEVIEIFMPAYKEAYNIE